MKTEMALSNYYFSWIIKISINKNTDSWQDETLVNISHEKILDEVHFVQDAWKNEWI